MQQKTYMRSIRSSGVLNCLFLCAREWGIDLQERKKTANPRGCARGGGPRMDTSKIETCITGALNGEGKGSVMPHQKCNQA